MNPTKVKNKIQSLIEHRIRMLLKRKGKLKNDLAGQMLIRDEIGKALDVAHRMGWY
jgi:hypothetical protein